MVDKTRNAQMATFFWNAYSNLQSQVQPLGGYDFNRELLTYIQADERYVSYMEDYADMNNVTGTARDRMLGGAQETHAASSQTLDTSAGYSTDMQGLANDFYFTIEQSYENAPKPTPVPATQPTDTALAATQGAAIAIPATPEAITVAPESAALPETHQAYDADFTRQQLGSMAEKPAAGVTQTPTTTPIAAADMPIPQPNVPVAETPRQEDTRTTTDYTVGRGDNLWKIAQNFYGLEQPRDIQRAVDYIAATNGMTEGTRANRLGIGQVIQLPNSPVPPENTQSLNWTALDAETKGNLRSQFRNPAQGVDATSPAPESAPEAAAPIPAARPLARVTIT